MLRKIFEEVFHGMNPSQSQGEEAQGHGHGTWHLAKRTVLINAMFFGIPVRYIYIHIYMKKYSICIYISIYRCIYTYIYTYISYHTLKARISASYIWYREMVYLYIFRYIQERHA